MDSKEVQEALQKRDIDDLGRIMDQGFKGVHDRQDKTNGRIEKAEGAITVLEKQNIERVLGRKYEKLIWYILTFSLSVIVGLVSYIIYNPR